MWKPDDLQITKMERSRLKILSTFFDAPTEGFGLTKVATMTELSKKTVWKNLDSMKEEKLVGYNQDTRKYKITKDGVNEYVRLIQEEKHRKMEKTVVLPLDLGGGHEFQGSGMVSINGPILPKEEEAVFRSDFEREMHRMMNSYNPFKNAKEVHVTLHFTPRWVDDKKEDEESEEVEDKLIKNKKLRYWEI